MKTLVIFLNNKLITCDTIVPFVYEVVSQRPEFHAHFICFNRSTEVAIRRNIMLNDAIEEIGELQMMGFTGKGLGAWLRHRATVAIQLAKLLFLALTGRAVFLHFKALNFGPLRLLGHLAESRTMFFQGSQFGVTAIEQLISDGMKPRKHVMPKPLGKYWASFNDDWREKGRNRPDQTCVQIPRPILFASWQRYIRQRGEQAFQSVIAENRLPDCSLIAAMMLPPMDNDPFFDGHDRHFQLFDEIFEVMAEVHPNMPVFIKPHPASSPHILERIREHLKKVSIPHAFCEIHPLALAGRSAYVIGIGYSTTFGFFRSVGIPTIEYAAYRPDLLEMSNNGSMRPDMVMHFINNDRAGLKDCMAQLVANRSEPAPLITEKLDLALFGDLFR